MRACAKDVPARRIMSKVENLHDFHELHSKKAAAMPAPPFSYLVVLALESADYTSSINCALASPISASY